MVEHFVGERLVELSETHYEGPLPFFSCNRSIYRAKKSPMNWATTISVFLVAADFSLRYEDIKRKLEATSLKMDRTMSCPYKK